MLRAGPSVLVQIGLAGLQLAGGHLAALLIAFQLVGDLLAFIERAQTSAFDRGDVNEHIVSAVVGLDETEAFLAVKPLHDATWHFACPFRTQVLKPTMGVEIKFSVGVDDDSKASVQDFGVNWQASQTRFDRRTMGQERRYCNKYWFFS